jgi:tripartite ATP-independent transporter DctP family solute receptor
VPEKMMQRSRWILAIALTTVSCIGVAQARDFRSSDVNPPDHPAVKAVVHMSDVMRERSGGRLRIDPGAADRDTEIFTVAQVRTGTLDMARVSVSALHGAVPATVIPTLPFLFSSAVHRRRILDGPVGDELLASLAAYDLIGLCFYESGARSVYTPDKPIRTPADMKGLKIRVQTSPAMMEVMQALGALPVATPFGQVRAQLAARTIDAAENNFVSYLGARHHEVARIYSLTEHATPPAVVLFSKRVWDQLPDEDRQIIRQAARDSVLFHRKLFDEQEAAARKALTDAGVQFVTDVDRAAFVQVLTPLYPKLVTDPRHRAVVERVRASE